MNKNKSLLALLIIGAVINLGCTSVRKIGEVNGVELTRVTMRSAFAPNVNALITSDPKKPGVIDVAVQASGPAITGTVVGAASGVGAAAIMGRAIRPDKTVVNAQGGGGGYGEGGVSDSVAQGGSSYATGGQGGQGGQAYSSAGATSSSASQSASNAQSDSWSGVQGSGNSKTVNKTSHKH